MTALRKPLLTLLALFTTSCFPIVNPGKVNPGKQEVIAEGTVVDAVTLAPVASVVELQGYHYDPPDFFDTFGGPGHYEWSSLGSDSVDPATGDFRIARVMETSYPYTDFRVLVTSKERYLPEGLSGSGWLRYTGKYFEVSDQPLSVRLRPHGILWINLRMLETGPLPDRINVRIVDGSQIRGVQLEPPIPEHFHEDVEAGSPLSISWTVWRGHGHETDSTSVVAERFGLVELTIEY